MKDISSESRNEAEGRTAVPAVSRAARVLEAISEAAGPVGVSDLARSVSLSKSTVHALVTALVREGFLIPIDGTRGYALGPRLVELGIRARDQRLLEAAESELQGLALRTGETALFGALAGSRVLILARRESSRLLNLSAPVGSSVPVMVGALGKAYLASLDTSSARSYLERNVLPSYTERSITSASRYLEQVEEARQQGYAADRGEYIAGISALASAFQWAGGWYFVWVVGIDAMYNSVELDQVGTAVRDAAQDILQRLESVASGADGRKPSKS